MKTTLLQSVKQATNPDKMKMFPFTRNCLT